MHIRRSLVLVPLCFLLTSCQVYYQPEQVHISYGEAPDEMVITWVTLSDTSGSIVEFGTDFLNQVVKGTSDVFIDGGSTRRHIYMHRANLTGLVAGQKYRYHVGGPDGWSDIFTFTAMKVDPRFSPCFAVFGDMGNTNAQSLARLQEDVARGMYDFILHVGDFAYNMDTNNATVGDEFMRQISTIAAYVPYMTCPGNHESAYNFSNYKSRFTMPPAGGDGENMWYSFNVGPIHFIAWDTEVYYYTNYGTAQIANQYKWLERDLIEATKIENRAKRPWIVTFGHRPMYCSNSDDPPHCTNVDNLVRVGDPTKGWSGIEDLFYRYGVDLEFGAHEHSYERFWPVYNMRVCNGSRDEPYKNPNAPVHIVTGSAGCSEGEDPFYKIPWPWSAYRSDDYGYNRFTVNATHLYMEYVSDDQGGKVVDKMWMVKDKRAPYTCHL